MSTIAVNTITDASGGNTAQINSCTPTAYNTMGRNRIINGAMEIDQRNAGASVTPSTNGTYLVDRWQIGFSAGLASKFTVGRNLNSVTLPNGFSNYFGIQVASTGTPGSTDNSYFAQPIEANNMSDLGWGTANAKSVTLSFKVYSSLTGTFSGSLFGYSSGRSYPFTFSIGSANTWTSISITIPGDTSGTWAISNSGFLYLLFNLGSGSSNLGTANAWSGTQYFGATGSVQLVSNAAATLYITGVQLEVGSVATEFERRPYGTELALCQRYYQKSFNTETKPTNGSTSSNFATFKGAYLGPVQRPGTGFTYPGTADDGGGVGAFVTGPFCAFAVKMRTTPSMQNYGNSTGNWWICDSGGNYYYVNPFNTTDQTGATGFCPNFGSYIGTNTFAMCSGHWTATAEL